MVCGKFFTMRNIVRQREMQRSIFSMQLALGEKLICQKCWLFFAYCVFSQLTKLLNKS